MSFLSLQSSASRPTYEKVDGMLWGGRSPLVVLLPKKTKDGLVLGDPIKVVDCMAIGSGGHSGGTSFAVTTGHLTHIVYTTLPKDTKRGGNPVYIATIDRQTRTVVAREFLVNADPKNPDVHTRPTITKDSKGYLHVLSGSHGQPFYSYMRSLKPYDITGGWTKPVKLTGRQCYASIVCDKDDRLHSVFREWLPHPSLGYESASAADGKWSKSTTLVDAAKTDRMQKYGIFYHRLFIDRASNLYLSFTFFEFKTNAKGNYPQVLVVSRDGGDTWQLVRSDTFTANIEGEPQR